MISIYIFLIASLQIKYVVLKVLCRGFITGNPGSVIVPQYYSSKIRVFVGGKNTILKFVGNTKYKSMKLTLQLVVVVLIAPMKFHDNLFKFTLYKTTI